MQEAQDNQDMPNLEEIKNENRIDESESID
jgi:hypothetical protein